MKTVAFDLDGKDMKKKIIEDDQRPLEIGIWYPSPEDGSPYGRLRKTFKDSFFHLRSLSVTQKLSVSRES